MHKIIILVVKQRFSVANCPEPATNNLWLTTRKIYFIHFVAKVIMAKLQRMVVIDKFCSSVLKVLMVFCVTIYGEDN